MSFFLPKVETSSSVSIWNNIAVIVVKSLIGVFKETVIQVDKSHRKK